MFRSRKSLRIGPDFLTGRSPRLQLLVLGQSRDDVLTVSAGKTLIGIPQRKKMFNWLRGRGVSRRVGVIESVQLDGKRGIILVRRDNIEHLVLVGGRTDVVIEPNIMRRPVPKPAHRPARETSELPPPSVPTREPLAEPPPKSRQLHLRGSTGRLEAELRGSPPLRRQSPPMRTEAGSSAQSEANVQVEPNGEEVVANDSGEKNRRVEVE